MRQIIVETIKAKKFFRLLFIEDGVLVAEDLAPHTRVVNTLKKAGARGWGVKDWSIEGHKRVLEVTGSTWFWQDQIETVGVGRRSIYGPRPIS
jgi:hypothetical protein